MNQICFSWVVVSPLSSSSSSAFLVSWLLGCVCPSTARVKPGQHSSLKWKKPLNGCIPQPANILAEAEGGSAAGATLRRGSGAGSPPVAARTHAAGRQAGRRQGRDTHFSVRAGDDCVL